MAEQLQTEQNEVARLIAESEVLMAHVALENEKLRASVKALEREQRRSQKERRLMTKKFVTIDANQELILQMFGKSSVPSMVPPDLASLSPPAPPTTPQVQQIDLFSSISSRSSI
jgi:hypothetical protein